MATASRAARRFLSSVVGAATSATAKSELAIFDMMQVAYVLGIPISMVTFVGMTVVEETPKMKRSDYFTTEGMFLIAGKAFIGAFQGALVGLISPISIPAIGYMLYKD